MEPDDPGPPSVEEQLDAFEHFLLGLGRSAATVKRYKGIMRQHFRGEPENDVTRKALSAWTRFLEEVGGWRGTPTCSLFLQSWMWTMQGGVGAIDRGAL